MPLWPAIGAGQRCERVVGLGQLETGWKTTTAGRGGGPQLISDVVRMVVGTGVDPVTPRFSGACSAY